MLHLLLNEIQDSSETAIGHLLLEFEKLKITDIEGENVNVMIGRIRSIHKTLESVSSDDRNYVPSNFIKTVLSILQTSSHPKFNALFEKEHDDAVTKAHKQGGLPEWPQIEEVFNLATNDYKSRSNTGDWCVPTKKGTGAFFNGLKQDGNKSTPYWLRPDYNCFNCESSCGKPLKDCPQPRNEERIKKNKEAYAKANPRKQKRKWIAKKGEYKGRPMMLNRKGAHGGDVKRERKMKKAAETKATNEKSASACAALKAYLSQDKNNTEESKAAPTSKEAEPSKPRVSLADIAAMIGK